MSEKDWKIRLSDILDCIGAIQSFTKGMSYEEFANNRLVLDAVVRNIEIIGEASKKIPEDVLLKYPQIPWRNIKGMRDVIAHDYVGVSKEAVWGVVANRLRELKSVVEIMSADDKI